MIKLIFKEIHKSITKFNTIEFPDLTVLTGVNGSGKSHLLQAIEQNKVSLEGLENSHTVLFNYETFRLENENAFNAQQLSSERQAAWQFYNNNIKTNIQSWKSNLKENYQKLTELCDNFGKNLWELKKTDINDETTFNLLKTYKQNISTYFRNNNLKGNQQAQAILTLIKKLPKSIDEIEEESFLDLYKPFSYKNDFLPFQLGKVFTDYFSKYELNQYNSYRNTDYKENHHVLSNEDFIKVHGKKPWELVNKILESFNSLNYRVNTPEGLNRDSNFQIRLKHLKKPTVSPEFTDLSSGERILMALVACIYKSSSDNHFPDILLLDEIDASLHPSMIQNLLDVIKGIFLERGVKIILVSHSPTTIALAPEEAIFVVHEDGENRIEKKTANEALSILTEGYATLDEGLKLFDQISKKEISIITEGDNTKFITKALGFFGGSNKEKIEIITGAEGNSGKTQLKTIFDFFSKVPHEKKVLCVWDCDVTFLLTSVNNTTPFIFDKNIANTKVLNGIENLFPENLFTDEFYSTESKKDGGIHTSLKKNKFKDHMINNGTETDFINFKPLFKEIEKLITSN